MVTAAFDLDCHDMPECCRIHLRSDYYVWVGGELYKHTTARSIPKLNLAIGRRNDRGADNFPNRAKYGRDSGGSYLHIRSAS